MYPHVAITSSRTLKLKAGLVFYGLVMLSWGENINCVTTPQRGSLYTMFNWDYEDLKHHFCLTNVQSLNHIAVQAPLLQCHLFSFLCLVTLVFAILNFSSPQNFFLSILLISCLLAPSLFLILLLFLFVVAAVACIFFLLTTRQMLQTWNFHVTY